MDGVVDPQDPPMRATVVKSVRFYRHGQGLHNEKDVDPATGKAKSRLHIFDPALTATGEDEARQIQALVGSPQVAFVSPLWRTLQTCELGLANVDPGACPRFALEDVREAQPFPNHCNC